MNFISFWVGLSAVILSIVTTFFKLEERTGKHHVSHVQYSDLYNDLHISLLEEHDERKVEEWINLYNEKEKFINAYEPNISSSILYRWLSKRLKPPDIENLLNY